MTTSSRILAVWLSLVAAVALAGCTDDQGSTMPPVPERDELSDGNAHENLAAMQALMLEAIDTAAPGSTVQPLGPGETGTPTQEDCTAPLEGQKYYGWSVVYHLPGDEAGDTALAALSAYFEDKGFVLDVRPEGRTSQTIIGRTDMVSVKVAGSKTSPRVHLIGSSACGEPVDGPGPDDILDR